MNATPKKIIKMWIGEWKKENKECCLLNLQEKTLLNFIDFFIISSSGYSMIRLPLIFTCSPSPGAKMHIYNTPKIYKIICVEQ